MTNKYLLTIYENVKQKDKNEPEFLQAVYEVLNSIPAGNKVYDSEYYDGEVTAVSKDNKVKFIVKLPL